MVLVFYFFLDNRVLKFIPEKTFFFSILLTEGLICVGFHDDRDDVADLSSSFFQSVAGHGEAVPSVAGSGKVQDHRSVLREGISFGLWIASCFRAPAVRIPPESARSLLSARHPA
jgi:hypothetical protein